MRSSIQHASAKSSRLIGSQESAATTVANVSHMYFSLSNHRRFAPPVSRWAEDLRAASLRATTNQPLPSPLHTFRINPTPPVSAASLSLARFDLCTRGCPNVRTLGTPFQFHLTRWRTALLSGRSQATTSLLQQHPGAQVPSSRARW
jgi:hypothetical protein